MNFDNLKEWVGKSELLEDIAAAAPLAGLAATLDHATTPWRSSEVPPLGHWLYFLPRAKQSEISEDGHPKRGGFLPPVPLPRRMWAGSRLTFKAPIRIGEPLQRRSTIIKVDYKNGRTGALVFVTVAHELTNAAGQLLYEEQDIVYKEEAPQGEAQKGEATPSKAAPAESRQADWNRTIIPDPVLLFRYSALTFNAHRIHYDRPYCSKVEGYPGLVVHGPLTATMLIDLFLRNNPGAVVTSFSFRGQRPLFDINPFTLCGKARDGGAELWAVDSDGQVAMTAELKAQRQW